MLEGESCLVPVLRCFIAGEKPFMVQLLLPHMCRNVVNRLRDVKFSKDEEKGSIRKRVKRESLICVFKEEDGDEGESEVLHGSPDGYGEIDSGGKLVLDEGVSGAEEKFPFAASINNEVLHGNGNGYGEIDEIVCNVEEKKVFSAQINHKAHHGYGCGNPVEYVSYGEKIKGVTAQNDHESCHSYGYGEIDERKLLDEVASNGVKNIVISARIRCEALYANGYLVEREKIGVTVQSDGDCISSEDAVKPSECVSDDGEDSFTDQNSGDLHGHCQVKLCDEGESNGSKEVEEVLIVLYAWDDEDDHEYGQEEDCFAENDEDQHRSKETLKFKPFEGENDNSEAFFQNDEAYDSSNQDQGARLNPFERESDCNKEEGKIDGGDVSDGETFLQNEAHCSSNQDQVVRFRILEDKDEEAVVNTSYLQDEEAHHSLNQDRGSELKHLEGYNTNRDEAHFGYGRGQDMRKLKKSENNQQVPEQEHERVQGVDQCKGVELKPIVCGQSNWNLNKCEEVEVMEQGGCGDYYVYGQNLGKSQKVKVEVIEQEEEKRCTNYYGDVQDRGTEKFEKSNITREEGEVLEQEQRQGADHHCLIGERGTRRLRKGETDVQMVGQVLGQERVDTSYLPGLDDSVGLRCLAFVPVSEHWRIKGLSARHRGLISGSSLLLKLRQEYKLTEQWICIFTSGNNGWTAFDPRQNVWRSLPHANVDPNFVLSDKESLSAGSHLLWLGREAFDFACYKYDLVSNTWNRGPPMVNPRCLFASASCGHHAFVAGGFTVGGMQFNVLNTAERYDSMRGVWEPLPNMATPRHKCSGFFMDGKFYVIGGKSITHEPLTSAEEYDPEKNVWRTIENMYSTPPCTPSFEPSPPLVAVAGNELYAIESSNNLLKVYVKQTNTWKVLGPVPVRADFCNGWGLAFKALGNELFVIGGHRVSGEEREGVAVFSWRPRPGASVPEWQLVNSRVTGTGSFLFNCAVMAC